MIGTTVGHFRIEKKLGAGGMGEVYRARDTRLGRDVALKLLPEVSAERLARFEREARAVAGLAHPNIVVLHEIEEYEGHHYLVLELVEGQDLTELVTAGGLPLARVLELAIPLADALASAHERGVVHRDLKPANIKLARDGRVKVLDFGLAKLMEADLEVTQAPVSGAGQVMGTIPYMAPEQIRGEAVDARADLFAFGVIVHELAAGFRPFGGATLADVSSAILRDAPAPLPAELPEDFRRLVERCLAKDPRERVQTAIDVANELRRIRAGKALPGTREPDEVSIAVLPFANRSAHAEDEYFAEGLADELLGVLAQIRGLRVIARTSSGRFKGTTEDAASIGRQLQVTTLLEGSVRKSGDRVRIGVQLVRAASGDTLWSRTYDRTLDDVFAVQDDIAQSVVKELRKTLLGEADDSDASREAKAEVAKAAAQGRSANPEAQDLLLRGRHIGLRRTPEDQAHAIRLLERAVALDPLFAGAWAELGGRWMSAGQFATDPQQAARHYESARQAIQRAIELAPDLGEAHARLARIRLVDLDWRGASAAVRRGLEVAPTNPVVMTVAATILMYDSRFDEAERMYQDVLRVEPLNSIVFHNFGLERHMAGRDEQAVESFRKSLELSPQGFATHAFLALSLWNLGQQNEARLELERERHPAIKLWGLALLLEGEAADRALAELSDQFGDSVAGLVAGVHAMRGDADAAFEWLERGRIARDNGMLETKCSRYLVPLHGDRRWPEFLRSLGFED